jgi:hypothetical protein
MGDTPMNEGFQKLFQIVLIVSVCVAVSSIAPANFNTNHTPGSKITISTTLQNVSQADIEGVKREARIALNSIPQIIGVEYRKNTKIKIIDSDICFASGNIVSLSISHIKDRNAPVIHEVTHILAKHENNSFFSEGLAVYFQERFSEFNGFPNFSVPLDDLVRSHQNQLMNIPHLKNDNKIFGQVGTEQRRLAYIEAGSFINFLVVNYGEQKLAELHNSRSLNFKEVYGKQIEELEAEWKSYVFGNQLIKT